MGNILNQDFIDFITALNRTDVEYLLVGGYAVIYHGYSRTTGDLDIWVNNTPENYDRLKKAFSIFGLSLFDMTEEKFLNGKSYDVFTFGRPPVSIDIITAVKGLEFLECYASSAFRNFENIKVRVIDIRDLLKAKKAANRPKDQDDVEHLEKKNRPR